jgi:site-specific DNA recombinase
MGLRLDGYVRVSRIGGREGEGYISPDVQREAITTYAQELAATNGNGGKLELAFYDDQDFSGGNIERPAFQAVLERLRSGETDGIVVMKVDRFARSVADGAAIVREIIDRRQVFASCHERIDPRTPEGKFMLTSFLANAELFLDQIKAGWTTAKARAVARGAHIGPTPIGYQRENGRLIPDPHYGPAIRELFKQAATGRHTDTELARWMTERAPRRSGREWQPSEVRRWLSNRVYLGEVHYGELVNAEAHEPLTDAGTWERCQREPGQRRVRTGAPFLLAGLVRCAHCRYAMTGQSHGGAKQNTPVYRCSSSCEQASVMVAERLDKYVRGLVVDRLAGLRLEAAENGTDLERLDREYEEAKAELQAFAADVNARQTLGEAGWQEALAARAADRDAKRKAREDAYDQAKLKQAARLDIESLDAEGLRDVLTGMVRCVFVCRRPRGASAADRALVVWTDDTRDIDLPRPHHGGLFAPVEW